MNSAEKTKQEGFAITGGKGFHITFANGWTVSVQFGPGNYSEHYDAPFDDWKATPSKTAEIAAFPAGKREWHRFENDDTVAGWKTPAEVLDFMVMIAGKEAASA